MNPKTLLAFVVGLCVLAGLKFQTVQADEGCPAGLTGRATFVSGGNPGKYKTCLRTTCSGVTYTKVITRMSTTIPPYVIIDATYKIQGGGISGLPYCLPEISDNSGWAYTP